MARTFKYRGIQEDIGLFDIVYAGIYTTKGGSATESINLRGVKSDDIALAIRHTTTTRAILTVAAGKNKVDVVFDGDPSTTHKINLVVLRLRRGTQATRRK